MSTGIAGPWRKPRRMLGLRGFASSAFSVAATPTAAGSANPPDGWSIQSGTWGIDADTDFTYFITGDSSIKIMATSAEPIVHSPKFAVEPQHLYHVASALRADSVDSVSLGITWYDSTETTLSSTSIVGGTLGAVNTWHYVGGYAFPPTNAAFADIRFNRLFAGDPFNLWIDQAIAAVAPLWFSSASAGNASLPDSTFTKVRYTQDIFDLAGLYDNSSSARMTAVRHGVWDFTASAQFDALADQKTAALQIKQNGTSVIAEVDTYTSGSQSPIVQVRSGPVELVAGDYVEVYAYQNSGGALDLLGNVHTLWFRGNEIGVS
jgi:hypothetical protein